MGGSGSKPRKPTLEWKLFELDQLQEALNAREPMAAPPDAKDGKESKDAKASAPVGDPKSLLDTNPLEYARLKINGSGLQSLFRKADLRTVANLRKAVAKQIGNLQAEFDKRGLEGIEEDEEEGKSKSPPVSPRAITVSVQEEKKDPRNFRVLTLDGGGVRGLIEIEVLIHLEASLKKVDSNASIDSQFDVIYGTSTGGILAALIRAKFSLEDIKHFYHELPSKCFQRSKASKFLRHKLLATKYTAAGMVSMFNSLGGHHRMMGQPWTQWDRKENKEIKDGAFWPKKFAVISAQAHTRSPVVFRNFEHKREAPFPNLSVTQALRATCAAPTYFPPLRLNRTAPDGRELVGFFIDGGLGFNNPSMVCFHDFADEFQSGRQITWVSLGTGTGGITEQRWNGGLLRMQQFIIKSASDSEQTHLQMADVFASQNAKHRYFRINPGTVVDDQKRTHNLGKIKLDTDSKQIFKKIEKVTEFYLTKHHEGSAIFAGLVKAMTDTMTVKR